MLDTTYIYIYMFQENIMLKRVRFLLYKEYDLYGLESDSDYIL
jgi:hypothetical protein